MRRWIPATTIASLALSACEPEATGPVMVTPVSPERAAVLFSQHCSICHGQRGDGQGARRRSLFRKPPDFRDPAWAATRSPASLRQAIRQGIPGSDMAAWTQLSDAEVAGLAEHVLAFSR